MTQGDLELRLESDEMTLELFDSAEIIRRINSISDDAIEVTVFYGVVAKGEVDLTNSTVVFQILKEHGIRGTMFTTQIKKNARPIVEKYKGYWEGAKGDNAMYIFGGLETAIRCSTEIMHWVDRDLTEYLKDYIVAVEILRERGQLKSTAKEQNLIIDAFIQELRQIKDIYGDYVPENKRELKEQYEKRYQEVDIELRSKLEEKRGRLVAKSGIIYGETEIKVTRDDLFHYPKPDFQGDVPYLDKALNDKISGPLSGNKDKIFVASSEPIKDWPSHILFRPLGLQTYGEKKKDGKQTFHLYEITGIDNFGHPSFDGRIPKDAPLLERLPQYRDEVLNGFKTLDELEQTYSDSSLPSLTIAIDEYMDRYKNGRSFMMSAISLAIADELVNIYEKVVGEYASQSALPVSQEMWYLTNVQFASSIREFMDLLKDQSGKFRETLLLSALLYNIGGSIARATSKTTPQYATRRLSPENNAVRLENEAANAYTVTSSYQELQERGLPDILKVQTTPISRIASTKERYAALILRFANRFVHNSSYRAWKVPLESPNQVVIEIRNDLSDIIDKLGYIDRMYWLTENALTNILGITEQVQMRRYVE